MSLMKKINTLFVLFFCSSLFGQNVKITLKDTFKYRDFVFYNKVYSYENSELASERKNAILKDLNKENEDFYWGDTMRSHLEIADLCVSGPFDFVLKTSLDQIKKTIYQPMDENFVNKYNENFSGYCKEIVDTAATYGFIEHEQTVSVTNVFFDIITIGNFSYGFSGGAHPNHWHNHFLIDLTDGRLLTFTDVFQPSKKNQLKSLLSSKFNTAYGKDNLLDQFEIAENFSVDKNGIHFLYNPYEITPYVVGDPEITISFSQAIPFFTPYFKSKVLPHLKTVNPSFKKKKP